MASTLICEYDYDKIFTRKDILYREKNFFTNLFGIANFSFYLCTKHKFCGFFCTMVLVFVSISCLPAMGGFSYPYAHRNHPSYVLTSPTPYFNKEERGNSIFHIVVLKKNFPGGVAPFFFSYWSPRKKWKKFLDFSTEVSSFSNHQIFIL